MTAGRGIIHSEMPERVEGEVRGFQLWINLPAEKKMMQPRYQNLSPEAVPEVSTANGAKVKIIAGEVEGVKGAITGIYTRPIFLDVHGEKTCIFNPKTPIGHTCFIYVYEGVVSVAGDIIEEHNLAIFGVGTNICLEFKKGAKAIIVAAKPIMQPISRLGPFVMNTREEINQAIIDFNNGQFLS